jgi:hypothetical protein
MGSDRAARGQVIDSEWRAMAPAAARFPWKIRLSQIIGRSGCGGRGTLRRVAMLVTTRDQPVASAGGERNPFPLQKFFCHLSNVRSFVPRASHAAMSQETAPRHSIDRPPMAPGHSCNDARNPIDTVPARRCTRATARSNRACGLRYPATTRLECQTANAPRLDGTLGSVSSGSRKTE